MANQVGNWDNAVPANGSEVKDAPATIREIKTNVTNTLTVCLDTSTGAIKNGAKGSEPATPIAGQIYYDTTNKVLEIYNGTAWKPMNYSVSEIITNPYSSSAASLVFRLNSGTAFAYGGHINMTFNFIWNKTAASSLTGVIELRVADTFNGLATASSVASVSVGNYDVETMSINYCGTIATGDIYWGVFPDTNQGSITLTDTTHYCSYVLIGG